MKHAKWEVVNRKPGITLIRDLDIPGYPTITNDAEWVYDQMSTPFHRRVIYQDTDQEWWEILLVTDDYGGKWRIAFKPWHGEVWDALSR